MSFADTDRFRTIDETSVPNQKIYKELMQSNEIH